MMDEYLRKAIKTNEHFRNKSLQEIAEEVFKEKNLLITALNLYSIDCLQKENVDLSKFKYVFIDGFLLCKITGILYDDKIKRISMDNSSILNPLFGICNKNKSSICIVGGSEDEAILAYMNIAKVYPQIKFEIVSSGYFSNSVSRSALQQKIVKLNPDIVFCSMGCVMQEKFLLELREIGFSGLGLTCGAFIRQTSRNLYYYPKIINDLNLRWLFRIWKEPKLLGRYFFSYPMSFINILRRH